jgi:hypothetical protein
MSALIYGGFASYATQYSIAGILRDGATVNGYFVLQNTLVPNTVSNVNGVLVSGNVSLLAENIKIVGSVPGETFNYTYGLSTISNSIQSLAVYRGEQGVAGGSASNPFTSYSYTIQQYGFNDYNTTDPVTVSFSGLNLDFNVKVFTNTGQVTAKLTNNSGLDEFNVDAFSFGSGANLEAAIASAAADGNAVQINTTMSSLRATAVICYAKGTYISTAKGMIPVEKLKVGDLILTVSGKHEPLKWLGFRTVDCKRHPNQEEAHPVRIAKDAFGLNQPVRDLYLSPLHSVYVDGILIPAIDLVNGSTVTQEVRSKITYFHVELPTHNAIYAEGLTAESYLDDNNRDFFIDRTTGQVVNMNAQFAEKQFADMTSAEIWAAKGFAKVMRDGPQVDAVRNKLKRQYSHQESQVGMEMAA